MNTRICRDVKRSEIIPKYDSTNLTPFFDGYDYSKWYKEKLGDLWPLQSGEKELKGGKRIKILTPNNLLTRLLILLALIKAENRNSLFTLWTQ